MASDTLVEKYLELTQLDVNTSLSDGDRPLLIATAQGQVAVVRHLIAACCADVNIRDALGNSSLHIAVQQEQIEIAMLLCQYGADVNSINEYGQTPLHLSCIGGLPVGVSRIDWAFHLRIFYWNAFKLKETIAVQTMAAYFNNRGLRGGS